MLKEKLFFFHTEFIQFFSLDLISLLLIAKLILICPQSLSSHVEVL